MPKATAFLVTVGGVEKGIVYKSHNTRSTTYPWQGKRYTGRETLSTGQEIPTTEFVGSVYVEGKGKSASAAARDCVVAVVIENSGSVSRPPA